MSLFVISVPQTFLKAASFRVGMCILSWFGLWWSSSSELSSAEADFWHWMQFQRKTRDGLFVKCIL